MLFNEIFETLNASEFIAFAFFGSVISNLVFSMVWAYIVFNIILEDKEKK